MQNFETRNKPIKLWQDFLLKSLCNLVGITFCFATSAQICPPNIDFENGTFNGWTCYTGFTSAASGQNVISLSASSVPIPGKHALFSANSGQLDPFGGFPVSCPNGSGYSIKLGSTEAGGQAEGVSYEFTIPANQNNYSLIYHYAVVYQSPNHRDIEQPRMEIEITNVTDNAIISCASFTFIAMGTSLPGFEVSNSTDTINVLYKKWTPVSIDLSGNAGKTIRLFFKTADCTFRRHFGYAYIDVNSECGGNLPGATFCPDDTTVSITAPFGYKEYTWFDSSLSQVLGNSQVLTLTPPPISGKTFAVKLEPYEGFGCSNTLYATVKDSLTITADAGKDVLSCNRDSVLIGNFPKQGLAYQWAPVTGLSNPNLANPFASPAITTNYVLTTNNSGGGCKTTDTVVVRSSVIDNSLQVVGKKAFCFGYGDSAVLVVQPINNIAWFRDDAVINGASQTVYRVNTGGTYYALLTNNLGCSIATQKHSIIIENQKPGIAYPVKYAVDNLPLNLNARSIGEQVLWKPGTYLNTSTGFAPSFKGEEDQLYTIEIRTNAGCLTVDTQLVKIIEKVEAFVPNAFTPNGDGRNDYLRPIFKGALLIGYFRVFNRWGQQLFEGKNIQAGWDGTYKGLAQAPQSLVWMLDFVGVDGKGYTQRGSCVLIR